MKVRPVGALVLVLMLIIGLGSLAAAPFGSGTSALFFFLFGAVWTAAAAFNISLALRYRRQARAAELLARTGTRTRATVVDAELGSLAIGDERKGVITFELELPGGARRRATRTMYVPRFALPHLQERLTLPAFVDPHDPERFEIQW